MFASTLPEQMRLPYNGDMRRTIVGARPDRSVDDTPAKAIYKSRLSPPVDEVGTTKVTVGADITFGGADITLVNFNMLYMHHAGGIERECHVPLGLLYLTRALEDEGFKVDFRDYQLNNFDDPFNLDNVLEFIAEPAPVIGLSCMANLLPFTILAIKEIARRYPDRTIILGGVGARSVEETILSRFPWVTLICYGEGERTLPLLMRAIQDGRDLDEVDGLVLARDGAVIRTPPRARIADLDSINFPAFHHIDLAAYEGYGVMTSRGCPYLCTFCSVAPVWDYRSFSRSNSNIIEEMKIIHDAAGADLFLFQDEFFLSGRERILSFCRDLERSGLDVEWKAFGRIDLVDREIMQAMADAGCIELRFGIESGSDDVLKTIKKGFSAADTIRVLGEAVDIVPGVDAFYMWGFPFETMDDFRRTLFQMTLVRIMGVRVLPSLLSLLPQTPIYREYHEKANLEFSQDIIPEYVFTGHEICQAARVSVQKKHRHIFDLIKRNPDIFPGFFHIDLKNNIVPKLNALQEFGFYPTSQEEKAEPESCGAHSPRKNAKSDVSAKGAASAIATRAAARC